MTKPKLPIITAAAIGVVAVVAFAIWGIPYFFGRVAIGAPTATFGSQSVRGVITAIVNEGQIEVDGRSQLFQVMRVQALAGEFKGVPFDVYYGKRNMRFDSARFAPGDEVYLLVNKMPDNTITAYYDDYVRARPMLILFGAFVLSIVILGRWKGLRSLAALAFSMLMIIGYIVPHILAGENPVKVSLIGSMVLLGVTLYFTYGWNLKTHASVLSMVLTLAIAGGLAALFVELTRLTGYGDESSMFLMQFSSVKIDPRGLLLGGMIIGSLGVLDDLVTSQSAAVVEIHDANAALGF
ncbi:MAG TPA: YibE/F family protein, partial [Anaerolineales bacterium]|nr:YibE/F family protein [Anaerolineales bacterium]